MINIEEFKKVEIRAGKILSVEMIENSEKLLKLSVDFGETEPKQVVSGIRKYFEDPQMLVGVTCAFVTNLEPRPIMGLESQAMILAASGDSPAGEFFSLLRMDCPPGSSVK
jgi:methionyl-tRNA synthetase